MSDIQTYDHKAYCREYYQKNKEILKERNKQRYKDNRELILSKNREYQKRNKEQIYKQGRTYYGQNKDKILGKQKEYRKNHKELFKVKDFKKHCRLNYKLTDQQILYIMENRSGYCPICNKYCEVLCVDHDHNTMKFRGLICDTCNKGIGLLKEDIDIYASAIVYLVDNMYTNFIPVSDDVCRRCEKHTNDFYHNGKVCTDCVKKKRNKEISNINSTKFVPYGLTEMQYILLLSKANNRCQICNSEEELKLDHCHNSNKPRGFLCHSCNAGIGMFKDDIEIIQNTIQYIQKGGVL